MADHAARARQLITRSLRDLVRSLDERVAPDQALELLDWFVEVERLAAAGKTLAAGLAVAAEPWRATGDRSAADWLATRADSTIGDARAVLNTASRLGAAPATREAFLDGNLTVAKADAIVAATAVAPEAEAKLLHTARHASVKRVRDDAARIRAAADPNPEARHARIHQERTWRRWTDADGARCGTYRLTPEAGAIVEAAAQPFTDAAIDHARNDRRDEPFDALAADGLVAMAQHQLDLRDGTDTSVATEPAPARGGRGRKRLRARRELIALVDLTALQRGHTHTGETCEIAGVGPVPVEVVRELFGDALLRIVIRNGTDVTTVVHSGRTASAVQETAVLVRQRGRCGKPFCDRPATEIDHRDGYARTGPVTLDELLGLCGPDHDLKTNHGHTWRRHADGTITWIRPDGTEQHERPPP